MILFSHLQRSGGHAVIDFYIANVNVPVVFFNNLSSGTHRPAQTEYIGEPPYHKVYSVENFCCEELFLFDIEKRFVILRSFENFLASIWRYPFIHPQYLTKSDLVDIWINHAEFCHNNPDKCVLFDKFIQSKEYRQDFCDRCGIEHITDKSLSKVSHYGGGSSFSDLNVLNRHKYIDDDEYRFFLERHENVLELSNEIFK